MKMAKRHTFLNLILQIQAYCQLENSIAMEFPIDFSFLALVFGCLPAVGVVLSVMMEWKVISAMAQQGALARPSAPSNGFPSYIFSSLSG